MQNDALFDILQLKNSNIHQNDGLKYLWIELENQKQHLKLITSSTKTSSKKQVCLLKILHFMLPYFNLNIILQLRLLNKQFYTEVNKNKQIIINLIQYELETQQNQLYKFELTKQVSRELYIFIVKLNFYANKASQLTTVSQQVKNIISQMSDKSQIRAFEIAKQIEQHFKKKDQNEKKIESEILKGYFHVANGPKWQGNVTLVNEYLLYQQEMKRQKKACNLRILNNLVQGM